mgnify:FL=1
MVRGNTAVALSGSPFNPSQTRKNTSVTPRFFLVGEYGQPVLGRFPATLPGPDSENVLVTVQIDPERSVERLVGDLPVPHLDHDGVDEDRRVDPTAGPTRCSSPRRSCR